MGETPLQSRRSVSISESREGEWRAEEHCEEEGLLVYVALKYHSLDLISTVRRGFNYSSNAD